MQGATKTVKRGIVDPKFFKFYGPYNSKAHEQIVTVEIAPWFKYKEKVEEIDIPADPFFEYEGIVAHRGVSIEEPQKGQEYNKIPTK